MAKSLSPKQLTKHEFGRRLNKIMLERGWHQSELSRKSGLPRDSISVYIRGKSLPSTTSLQALATALGVDPQDLLPNHVESPIDQEPALEMKVSPNMPNAAWLRVNRLVSVKTALRIVQLLEEDEVMERGRSDHASSAASVES